MKEMDREGDEERSERIKRGRERERGGRNKERGLEEGDGAGVGRGPGSLIITRV